MPVKMIVAHVSRAEDSGVNVGAIVGGSVAERGSTLCLLGLLVFLVLRRRRRQMDEFSVPSSTQGRLQGVTVVGRGCDPHYSSAVI
jgi:hypothetical protein